MDYSKLHIPFDELGKEFVNGLDDDDKAILSIGMIPYDKLKLFTDILLDSIAEHFTSKGQPYDGDDPAVLKIMFSGDFLKYIDKELATAIYSHGNLIV